MPADAIVPMPVRRRGTVTAALPAALPAIVAVLRAALLGATLLACALPAAARMRRIDPGQVPALKADEALLVVAIDTDIDLDAVRLLRDGVNLDIGLVRGAGKGRSANVFAVPAGTYRLASVSTSGMLVRLNAKGSEAFAFEVRPGRINYPGDLICRRARVACVLHLRNRGLQAIDWLQAQHPALLGAHPFEYTGHYPDPFPALYRQASAGTGPIEDRTLPVPAAGPLPLPIAELWRPGQLETVELSPDGDLLAELVTYRQGDAWRWAIDLVDLRSEAVVRLYESKKKVSRLDWAGPRSLVLSVGEDHEPDALIVAHMTDGPEGRRYQTTVVPRLGLLVGVLRDQPGHILFQTVAGNGRLHVYRLDVRDQQGLKTSAFLRSARLNRGVDRDLRWFADARGRLRLAVALDKHQRRVLMHGLDGEFRQVMALDEDNDFRPLALSADGELIYGTAEKDRDQRELVEFDPATGTIARTLFALPGVDVAGVLLDENGALAGASHYRDGLLVGDYFQREDAALAARLRAAFPEQSVNVLQRDGRGERAVLAVGGSDQPTRIYLFDRPAARAMLVSETMPWLAARTFAPSHTIRARSQDGLDIEAYLTLPPGAGKRPLVVFPHGGPIGVRDTRLFDPEVQFLASLGYAVLQVNFRGSEGFGTAFRKAGERGYGSLIEDDIDAALAVALARYPLDPSRMCALGGSYGGYSAMVSAIRWPGRFKCAVSIAGISDRALFFTASDAGRSEAGRALLEDFIGDPNTDMDEMRRYSPLYRHAELDLPVMLVHGREDGRVDYEHTRRLVRMLNLAGRPPVLIALEDEGHGITGEANIQRVWAGIAGFLRTHLGEPPPAQ